MAIARRGGELRAEVHADEERMAGQLHDLRQVLARRARRDLVALRLELRHVDVVRLVAVAMALVDARPIDGSGQRPRLDRAALRSEAHGAAELRFFGATLDAAGAVEPLGDERHHRVWRLGTELRAVGAGAAGAIRPKPEGAQLHA